MVERLDKIRRRRFLEKSLAESLSAIGAPRAVLLGHLGLGDYFSEAPLIEMWSDLVDELVIVSPSESRSRLLSRVYSYLPNLIFENTLPTSGDGDLKQLRYRFKAPLVQVGSRVLRLSSLAFPGFGLNRKLCIGGLYARRTLSSARLRENLLALGAASIPARRFAFVDHHDLPGRRIPNSVLRSIRSRGLDIVLNPRNIPLEQLAPLMEAAEELHMVSSAPVSMALAAGLGKSGKFYYFSDHRNALMSDYGVTWQQWHLSSGSAVAFDVEKESRARIDGKYPWERTVFVKFLSQAASAEGRALDITLLEPHGIAS